MENATTNPIFIPATSRQRIATKNNKTGDCRVRPIIGWLLNPTTGEHKTVVLCEDHDYGLEVISWNTHLIRRLPADQMVNWGTNPPPRGLQDELFDLAEFARETGGQVY
jgi:hypothetical protein